MKKAFYIFLTAGALTLAGCAKDDVPFVETKRTVTLDAVAGDVVSENVGEDTRGGLVEGLGMHWHEGDKISLFRRGGNGDHAIDTNIEFTVSAGSFPAKTASFTGELRDVDPGAPFSQQPSHYVAVYPYAPGATHPGLEELVADSYVNTTLPAVQYYTNDNGIPGVKGIPMIARGPISDGTLNFHPMYAMLRLSVKLKPEFTEAITVKRVVVSVSGTATGEYLSGKVRINGVGGQTGVNPQTMGNHSVTWDASASKSLTLDCGEGVVIDNTNETILYIGVPKPAGSGGGLYGGYEFSFETEDGSAIAKTKTGRMVFENGVIYKLPTITINAPQAAVQAIIPDAELRAYLVGINAIEDLNDGNGTVNITNPDLQDLNLSTKASVIASIAGLEAFTNLKTLNLTGTGIVNLDITHLASLETFTSRPAMFQTSPVRSLNASGLKNLKTLSIVNNANLETLNISGCTALTRVECAGSAGTNMINGSTMQFAATFARTYMSPNLKTLIAEGLTQITRVTSYLGYGDASEHLTIPTISFKDCVNLNSMTLGGSVQTTAITMDITNTPLASNPGGITGDNGMVTYIR